MATKNSTIKDSQTIFDLSLQLYGSIENVFDIIINNNSIADIHHQALAGMVIEFEEQSTDLPVYFKTKGITIATNYPIVMDARSFGDSFDLSFR